MKLPNAQSAIIPKEKIVNYLLDPAHPDGGSKAAFFQQAGFDHEAWGTLAEALHQHAIENEMASEAETQFGRKFIIEAELRSPGAGRPLVRSVWVILHGEKVPRFVTAYPLKSRHD